MLCSLCITVVATAGVAAMGRSGGRASGLDLGPGTAWFASPRTGTVVLVDGPTATRVKRVDLAAPGRPIEVVQAGAGAYGFDREAGTVAHLDGARLMRGAVVAAGRLAPEGPAVLAAGGAAWAMVDGGSMARRISPDGQPGQVHAQRQATPPGPPLAMPAPGTSAAVGPDGALWALGRRGDLVSYPSQGRGPDRSATERSRTVLTGLGGAVMVMAGEVPVAVGRSEVTGLAAAVAVDPARGRARRSYCAGDGALVGGSGPGPARVTTVDSGAGRLVVTDLASGDCREVDLRPLGPDGADEGPPGRWGRAVAHGDLLFVPDFTSGQVAAVDPREAGGQVVARVDVGLPGVAFALFSHNGFVWFNDPASDRAGVIGADLRAVAVSTAEGPEAGTPVGFDPGAPNLPSLVSCRAEPSHPRPGQPVNLTAAAEGPLPADLWQWDLAGAEPMTASARSPAVTARWDHPGVKRVSVTGWFGPTGRRRTTCPVAVGQPPLPPGLDGAAAPPDATPPDTTFPAGTAPTSVPPEAGGHEEPPAELAARFDVEPNPARVGQEVRFTDLTSGQHSVVGWDFPSGAPGSATGPAPAVVWSVPGEYAVTLTVARSGTASSAQALVTVDDVAAPGHPVVSPTALPDATLGVPYSQALEATGGTAPYRWSLAGGSLPAGLVLEPEGGLEGTPDRGGQIEFAVRATDADGEWGERAFTMVTRGVTTRASARIDGTQVDQETKNTDSSVSYDGRFVAFSSPSSALVVGDTNGFEDVFVYDHKTRKITRVSVGTDGRQADGYSHYPAISASGRFVAFRSAATNLVDGDTNRKDDVFVHDREGTTTRVSTGGDGVEGDGDSSRPALSADGQVVAFESVATNLVAGDTNGKEDVFVRRLSTGVTTMASADSAGGSADGGSQRAALSGDGRFVAFQSTAPDLVDRDSNGKVDVFVRQIDAATTTRVSVDSTGSEGDGDSLRPMLSDDGSVVAFRSAATNLAGVDTNGTNDVFVHHRATGATARVSVDSAGNQANRDCYRPVLSGDGRYVGFWSEATNLVGGDDNAAGDIFVHDRSTGATARVSVDTAGNQANGESLRPALSGDGRYVVFSSSASNLVEGDTNSMTDVFLRQL